MRKQKSIRWFRYTVEDAKAAQAELDEQAERGWSYSSGEYEGLILRNGNQVLRIEGNQIDLTGAKTLADIRAWLAEGA